MKLYRQTWKNHDKCFSVRNESKHKETYLTSTFGCCTMEYCYVSLYTFTLNMETHYNHDFCLLFRTEFLQSFCNVGKGHKFLEFMEKLQQSH